MNTNTAVRLVPQTPQKNKPERAICIATTDPDLFKPYFQDSPNARVYIYDTGQEAIEGLNTIGFDEFYADVRALKDRWNGQRFLKYIRERPEFTKTKIWLMAESWYAHQAIWAEKFGADGMAVRDPRTLSDKINGTTMAQHSASLTKELAAIDEIFSPYAGPMRNVHRDTAREAMRSGHIDATAEAYANELASTLQLPGRAEMFLKELQSNMQKKKNKH